jgi:hypothetical protein
MILEAEIWTVTATLIHARRTLTPFRRTESDLKNTTPRALLFARLVAFMPPAWSKAAGAGARSRDGCTVQCDVFMFTAYKGVVATPRMSAVDPSRGARKIPNFDIEQTRKHRGVITNHHRRRQSMPAVGSICWMRWRMNRKLAGWRSTKINETGRYAESVRIKQRRG